MQFCTLLGKACAGAGLMVATRIAAVRPVASTASFGMVVRFKLKSFKGPPWDPVQVRKQVTQSSCSTAVDTVSLIGPREAAHPRMGTNAAYDHQMRTEH